jgi:DNA topoisomerase VI subunit B
MTGQPYGRFGAVVLKELLDNAVDATEHATAIAAYTASGDTPRVSIVWHPDAETDTALLTVTDNGCGIPPSTVAAALNFHLFASDKVIYRSPTRGAQGNALKTIAGIPYALGMRAPLVIEGQGVRHAITVTVDPAGNVRLHREETQVAPAPGTRVTLTLPAANDPRPLHWGRGFALFNPHLSVKIGQTAHTETGGLPSHRPISGAGIFTSQPSSSLARGGNTCPMTSPRPGGIAPRI